MGALRRGWGLKVRWGRRATNKAEKEREAPKAEKESGAGAEAPSAIPPSMHSSTLAESSSDAVMSECSRHSIKDVPDAAAERSLPHLLAMQDLSGYPNSTRSELIV